MVFKTIPFGRSGIPPGQEATRLPRQGEAGDHGQDGEGDGEEGATFTPSADAAADRDEDAEGQSEEQRRGEHVEHIGEVLHDASDRARNRGPTPQ